MHTLYIQNAHAAAVANVPLPLPLCRYYYL
jgi:hypothetical protein